MDKNYLFLRVVDSDIEINESTEMPEIVEDYFSEFYTIECHLCEEDGFSIDDKEKCRKRWIELCEDYEPCTIGARELMVIKNNKLKSFSGSDYDLFWQCVSDAFDKAWPGIVKDFNS